MDNYLAVDIGASSGRLVSATLQGGQLHLEELHRFGNSFTERDGHDYWNVDDLFDEIIKGLQKAKQKGIHSCTLGIDTWAVDYVLLDQEGRRIHDIYAYRDARTFHAPERLHQLISREDVYEKTGIQELNFNTLYQLFVHDQGQLAQANKILMVPDYLYYRLTGIMMNETTNASTMQLLNVKTRELDEELLALLQLRRNQFAALTEPGQTLGQSYQSLFSSTIFQTASSSSCLHTIQPQLWRVFRRSGKNRGPILAAERGHFWEWSGNKP